MKFAKRIICILSVLAIMVCMTSCNKKSEPPKETMTDNIFDFTFKIQDTTYTLPEDISSFLNSGFSYKEDYKRQEVMLSPKAVESTHLISGDNWLAIELYNPTDEKKAIKDCPVGRVSYDFSGDIKIYMAGNFLLNDKTIDEVTAKYGKPYSQTDYSIYTEIIYDKDPSKSIYDRYIIRFDKETKKVNYIDVTFFIY